MYESFNIFRIIFLILTFLGTAAVCALQFLKTYRTCQAEESLPNRSTKQKILTAITAVCLGFALLAPLFTFIKFGNFADFKLSGYSFIFSGESLEELLELSDAIVVISIISLLFVVAHIVTALIGAFISLKAYLTKQDCDFEKTLFKFSVSFVGLSFVYFIYDLIICGYIESESSGIIDIKSFTFIPFILFSVFVGSLFAVKFLLPEDFIFANLSFGTRSYEQSEEGEISDASQEIVQAKPRSSASRKNVAPSQKMDKFVEIRKFKELLDEGIITEADFESKKFEILEIKPLPLKKASEEAAE